MKTAIKIAAFLIVCAIAASLAFCIVAGLIRFCIDVLTYFFLN